MDVTKSSFICPKDFSDDSMIVWDLMLPEDVVPDSGRAYVNLVGNILGPALENLNKLVKLPMGCGEQNMILLVPNIYVIRYLDAIGSENPALRATALKNMEKGTSWTYFTFEKILKILLSRILTFNVERFF